MAVLPLSRDQTSPLAPPAVALGKDAVGLGRSRRWKSFSPFLTLPESHGQALLRALGSGRGH